MTSTRGRCYHPPGVAFTHAGEEPKNVFRLSPFALTLVLMGLSALPASAQTITWDARSPSSPATGKIQTTGSYTIPAADDLNTYALVGVKLKYRIKGQNQVWTSTDATVTGNNWSKDLLGLTATANYELKPVLIYSKTNNRTKEVTQQELDGAVKTKVPDGT